MRRYRNVLIAIVFCQSFPLFSYNYTFNNKVNADVEIKFQLAGVAEPVETIVVPKNSKVSRSFEGLRIGLCMNSDSKTLSVRKLPNGHALYPLVISHKSRAYSELLKTGKISAVDFGLEVPCKGFNGTAAAAIKCNKQTILCLNLDFEIYETDDNHFVLVVK